VLFYIYFTDSSARCFIFECIFVVLLFLHLFIYYCRWLSKKIWKGQRQVLFLSFFFYKGQRQLLYCCVRVFKYIYIYLYIYLVIYIYIYIYLCVRFICLFVCLFIYLFIYVFINCHWLLTKDGNLKGSALALPFAFTDSLLSFALAPVFALAPAFALSFPFAFTDSLYLLSLLLSHPLFVRPLFLLSSSLPLVLPLFLLAFTKHKSSSHTTIMEIQPSSQSSSSGPVSISPQCAIPSFSLSPPLVVLLPPPLSSNIRCNSKSFSSPNKLNITHGEYNN
jgi:hypothetical protein